MKFYTSVNQYGNNILVRGLNNGHAVQDRIAFKPALYVPTTMNRDKATAKSLFGKPLAEIKFESINDAKEYVKIHAYVTILQRLYILDRYRENKSKSISTT
jgi:hypothetical protein